MNWITSAIVAIILAVIAGVWVVQQDKKTSMTNNAFSITSPAFEHNGSIPRIFTCDEEGASNPELQISGVPEEAVSLAMLMDDPDIPQVFKDERGIDSFDHWTLFNIPTDTTGILEGESVGTVGVNGRGENGYTGPCPPPEYEPTEHRYFFKLYALDTELDLSEGATKGEVLEAMEGHIIEQTELVGLYDRAEKQ